MSPGTNFPQVPLDDPEKDWRNRPINYGFSADYPIFWGPGQLTIYPDVYMNPVGWRDAVAMAPPLVVRGFKGGKNVSPPVVPPPPVAGTCDSGRYHYIGTRRITTGQYISTIGATNTCTGAGVNLGSYWYMHAMSFSSTNFVFGGITMTPQQVLQGNTGLFRFGVFTTTSGSYFSNNTTGQTGNTSTTLTCDAGSETITHAVWGTNAGTQLPYPSTGLPDKFEFPDPRSGQLKPGQEMYYRDPSWQDRFAHYFYDCGGAIDRVCLKVTLDAGIPASC